MKEFCFTGGCIVGKSKPIKRLFNLIPQLASQDVPVLIYGEKGTGKELVSTAIHASSPKAASPFIKVNCALLDESSLGVELFGKVTEKDAGSQTIKGLFEIANGGTILLDNIINLPKDGQDKLLQVLQERKFVPLGAKSPVDSQIRVIATADTDLSEAVTAGKFNEELYLTMRENYIELPVLRRYREDIPVLISYFIKKYSQKHNKHVKGVSAEAQALLMEYEWPGNIRELEDCIEQAIIIEDLEVIQASNLPYEVLQRTGDVRQRLAEEYNLRRRLASFERHLILGALNEVEWKKKEAATLLGIDQRNLSYFLKKHHITDPLTRELERGSL